MIANFKNNNKIIVVGADKDEAILIQNLVENAKNTSKVLSITEYYDVEGEVNGFALDLKDVEAPVETNTEEEGE